jgi:hypothetical protein
MIAALFAWLAAHKALLGSIAAAAAAASGAVSPPYSEYLTALAIALAALSGGPRPMFPPRP